MAKTKSVYVCQNCGVDSPKWIGKCPSCGEWNSYVEEIISKDSTPKIHLGGVELVKQKPILITEVETSEESRFDTSCNELNRVLGGGLVPGSLVLIGGEPGIGKSTLVLQVVLNMKGKRTLYISGASRLTTAQKIIVHTWQIIMCQGITMNQLHSHSGAAHGRCIIVWI